MQSFLLEAFGNPIDIPDNTKEQKH